MKAIKLYLVFITILIVLSLIFSLADIEISSLKFSIDSIFNFLGVIVSSFALAIGAYFALLAVSAYSHIRNIQTVEEKINLLFKEISLNKEDIKLCINDFAATLYQEIDEQLSLDEYLYKLLPKDTQNTKNIEQRRAELRLKRARLCYNYPMLNSDLRKKLILELAAIGDIDDIKPLKKICDSSTENEIIKKNSQSVITILSSKFLE